MKSTGLIIVILLLMMPLPARPQSRQSQTPAKPSAHAKKPPVSNWNLNPFNESQGYILGHVANAVHVRPYKGVTGAVAGLFYMPLVVEMRLGTSTDQVDRTDKDCVDRLQREALQAQQNNQAGGASTAVGNAATSDPGSVETSNKPAGGSNDNPVDVDTSECRHRFTPIEVRTTDSGIANKLLSLSHSSVLVSFVERRIVFTTDVHTFVTDVFPTNPDHKFTRPYLDRIDNFPISSWFNVEKGTVFGRVVQAQVEGNVRESYLVTIEVSASNLPFIEMNIATRDLYDYAIECMLSDRPLKLYYLNLTGASRVIPDFFIGYRTPFRLYRIELAKADDSKPARAN